MIFEPWYVRWLKGLGAVLVIVVAWLWMSVDEYAVELEELAQEQARVERIEQSENTVEPEPELTEYKEPEPQHGWIVPPEPVRKKVAKVKRKVKRAVQK